MPDAAPNLAPEPVTPAPRQPAPVTAGARPPDPLRPDPCVPPHDGPLRVVVVDADDRTRESVVGLLGIRDRFRVVGDAGHLGAALRLVEVERPDVVILDPRLPDVVGGVTLIRAIRRIGAGTRILVVGWSPDLEHDTLQAGADGFVRKTFRPADLAEAVDRCMTPVAERSGRGPVAQE